MSEELIERARKGYAAFNTGEPDWNLYTPDFQLRNYPDAPWQPSPGPKGIQEWLDFTDEVAAEWGLDMDEFEHLDPNRVLATGRIWAKFRATGIRDELPMIQLLTFADGKMTRAETFYTREQALDAAGLSDRPP